VLADKAPWYEILDELPRFEGDVPLSEFAKYAR
jgi:hypothetical protein